MLGKKDAPNQPQAAASEKPGKPFYKKWWVWVLAVLVIAAIGGGAGGTADKEPSGTPDASGGVSAAPQESDAAEETPDIETSTELEALIWKLAKEHDCQLTSISTVEASETNEETTLVGAIRCQNDEDVINALLDGIAVEIKRTPEPDGVVLAVSDIKDKDDACIATIGVASDGSTSIVSMSINYNSPRNQWIRSQFSLWDGAHTDLEKLVKKQLNDEKSYEHIETTYRDISDEAVRDEVNNVLAESGYSNRVEVGDLFIQMQFSAKNAFGGVVKNTAFGISSYADNTITVVDIG